VNQKIDSAIRFMEDLEVFRPGNVRDKCCTSDISIFKITMIYPSETLTMFM